MDAILTSIDEEHLKSAFDDPRFRTPGGVISFGTMLWEEPAKFPREVPIYIYAVTRGLTESIPAATWQARFVRYQRREDFASSAQLDATRPKTTLDRRDHTDLDQQEPDWPGYLMVTELKPLIPFVPLSRFRVGGKPFKGLVVRHPMEAQLGE